MFGMMGGGSPFRPGINPMVDPYAQQQQQQAAPQPQVDSGSGFWGLMSKVFQNVQPGDFNVSYGANVNSPQQKLDALMEMKSAQEQMRAAIGNQEDPFNKFIASAGFQKGMKTGYDNEYAALREQGAKPQVDYTNYFSFSPEFVEQEKKRRLQLIDQQYGYTPTQY